MVTSGISMDKSAQKESLEWIRKESLDPNCVRSFPLMFATMLMCLSPKSGSFDQVWEQLDQDTQYPGQHPMPRGLRDMHYKHSEEITGGVLIENPFEQPFQIAKQNYMPKGFEGKRYYFAKDNLNEKKLEQQYLKLHKYIYGQDYKK